MVLVIYLKILFKVHFFPERVDLQIFKGKYETFLVIGSFVI